MRRIYLDHNATTPLDPRVLTAIIQELQEVGNPSSVHFHGQQARQRLDHSRQIIAGFLGVKPHELFFTSGGTESANLLLKGGVQAGPKGHIISSDAEHACVYKTLLQLEQQGHEITLLPTGPWGAVSPKAVKEAIKPNTKLITLIAANNETGVKTDIEAIASLAEAAGIPLIIDGVALLGKERISIPKGVTAQFFSGHKVHAPKGVGIVFCRNSLKMNPLLTGGNQEYGRRAGTENLPGIVGVAEAIRLLSENQETFTEQMCYLRDRLESGLKSALDGVIVNGQGPRIANTSNLCFEGIDGETLLISLDLEGLSVSHGSACTSGALEPSRILLNMGLPLALARSAIRFSLSRFTTTEEIDSAIAIITRVINKLRK